MKTLNEVINAVQDILRVANLPNDDLTSTAGLALYYLKEYQDLKATMNWHAEMELIRNELIEQPLTWNELKQMEGKPVWVEDNIDESEDLQGYWAIYRKIDKAQVTEYALLSDLFYDKAEYGKSWQAYRKERKVPHKE